MEIQIICSKEEALRYIAGITSLLYENLIINMPNEGWTMDDARDQADSLLLNLEKGSAFLFIAARSSEVMGFAWAYKRQIAKQKRFHLNHIIVSSSRRGEGIGRAILDAVVAKAKDMQMDAVDLFSSKDREEVVRFYSQNGFSIERLQMVLRLSKTE